MLYHLADLTNPAAVAYANVSLQAGIAPCFLESCRPSSVAWAGGYWSVIHYAVPEAMGEPHTIKVRMFDPAGVLIAGGSPQLTMLTGAGTIALGPHVGLIKSGITTLVAPDASGNRYARWGCN